MNSRIYQPVCMLCLVMAQFVYPPSSSAQSLKSIPLSATSAWQKQQDYVETHIPGKLDKEMKKVVGALASWAQRSGGDSLGYTPAWCGAYFSNRNNAFPLFKYEMRSGFFSGDMGPLNAEPGNEPRLSITANDLGILQQTFAVNGQDYLYLPQMTEVFYGVQYAELVIPGAEEGASGRQVRIWVLSREDRQLFNIVSRREYLEAARLEIAADKQRLKEDLQQRIPVKTAEQEEAAQKREIESIESMYSGATRDARVRSYRASYKPDSVYFREVFAKQSASLDADSVMLEDMLKAGIELGRPAFVSTPAREFRGFDDGKPGAKMLAKWNMEYFDKGLSLAAPQLMVVAWQFNVADKAVAGLDELVSGLDYCDLQTVLGSAVVGR